MSVCETLKVPSSVFDLASVRSKLFVDGQRASTTASAVQVRQPIYDTSVGKWRHFASQLEPLRASLERAGIDTR